MNEVLENIKERIEGLEKIKQEWIKQWKKTINPFERRRLENDINCVCHYIQAYQLVLEDYE